MPEQKFSEINNSQINRDWFMRHRMFLAVITFVIIGAGIIMQLKIEHYRKNFKLDLPVHVEKTPLTQPEQ